VRDACKHLADRQCRRGLFRNRAGNSARNFSLLNRIALNLLRQETSSKRGIKEKRLKAGDATLIFSNHLASDMRWTLR
jgi:hypothetical protein